MEKKIEMLTLAGYSEESSIFYQLFHELSHLTFFHLICHCFEIIKSIADLASWPKLHKFSPSFFHFSSLVLQIDQFFKRRSLHEMGMYKTFVLPWETFSLFPKVFTFSFFPSPSYDPFTFQSCVSSIFSFFLSQTLFAFDTIIIFFPNSVNKFHKRSINDKPMLGVNFFGEKVIFDRRVRTWSLLFFSAIICSNFLSRKKSRVI